MSITIHSIAKNLKISPTTVSMALNDSPRVAEKTRRLVKEYAAKCNFVPSENARNLRLQKSSLVAVVVYDITSSFWSGAVSAIESALGNVYSVVLCNSYGDLEHEKRIIQTLRLRGIAGVIITPASTEVGHLIALQQQGIPVVLFERTNEPSLSFVKGDDAASTARTVEMCCRDGHHNIALLSASTRIIGIIDRIAVFHDTVKRLGIAGCCAAFELPKGDIESIKTIFLQRVRDFSVVLCMEDEIAAKLLTVLIEANIRVPDDLSIISWNNSNFLDYLPVPLTSIRVPVREMAVKAAEIVQEFYDGKCDGGQCLLAEEIVFRKSYKQLSGLENRREK